MATAIASKKRAFARFILDTLLRTLYFDAMVTLYMIRHGQASFGQQNYDRLSQMGVSQMRALAAYLADIFLEIDAVYSGPLERQKSSALEVVSACREFGKEIPDMVVVQDLTEFDYRSVLASQVPDMVKEDPSLKNDLQKIYTDGSSFQKVFGGAVFRWASGRFDKPGVETWDDFSAKTCSALTEIASTQGSGGNILVFTSGGCIAAAIQHALDLSSEHAVGLNWQLVNSSITKFAYRNTKLTLAGYNAIAHLELKKEKKLITYR
jgi:broad specificity phosphatase PhoE